MYARYVFTRTTFPNSSFVPLLSINSVNSNSKQNMSTNRVSHDRLFYVVPKFSTLLKTDHYENRDRQLEIAFPLKGFFMCTHFICLYIIARTVTVVENDGRFKSRRPRSGNGRRAKIVAMFCSDVSKHVEGE